MPNNNMTFGVDLLPNSTTSEFNLGSSEKKWNLYVNNINGSTPALTDTTYSAEKGISLSNGKFGHSNTAITAQTTQAIYPIKIDAYGHITAYGDAVTPLTSHQTIKQDGLTGATINRYGACSTAANTAAKTVDVTNGTVPTLNSNAAGLKVTVNFANANTASTPTLNVNSKGAKNIFHRGTQITTGTNKTLLAGVCDFIFDGTQWHLVGNYYDTTYTAASSAPGSIAASGSVGSSTNYARQDHTHAITVGQGDSSGEVKIAGQNASVNGWTSKANLASPEFTGTPKAPTASAGTNTTQIATTAFVTTAISNSFAANDAMQFKGTIAGGSTGAYGALTSAANAGDTYKVSTAGKINGIAVEVGDMLICTADNTAAANSSNYGTIAASWTVVQTNIDGAVTGPASSTENRFALFDGETGKVIKDSGVTLDTSSGSTKKWLTEKGTWTTPSYSQVGAAASSHTHGNLSNDGKITQSQDLAVNDYIIIGDNSDGGKLIKGPTFDASTTTKCLTKSGTWEDFNNYELPTATDSNLGGIKIGYTESNKNYAVKLSSAQAYVTVPWTDTNVTQTEATSSTAGDYEVLFTNTSITSISDNSITEGVKRYSNFKYTPSTDTLSVGKISTTGTINGLTFSTETSSFSITGGNTTSKTLTINNNYVLGAACEKGYENSTSASALSTGSNLVTESDVYYGLPTINGGHSYTSNTNIYVPTSVGTQYQFLTADSSGYPTWTSIENTALSTWAGTSNITTIGTITNTIKSTSGFELTLSDINANLANNNISGEDDVFGNYLIRDVNNKALSCFRSAIRPNGDIYTQLYACNYNTTDNTSICTPRIDLIAYKTGLGYFTISIPHTVLTLYTDSPTATRSYLKLNTDIDGHIDIRFARQSVDKWSISSRNSTDNIFGIFNHSTNTWALTITESNSDINLYKALTIANGGTGATSAQDARVNLGAFPRIDNVSAASALNIRKNSITYSDGATDGGETKFYGTLLTMTQNTNESDSSRVSQLFIQSSSANADMKVRTYSGQWNAWKTVYTSATTVPVSNGGTGATSFTANSVIMSGSSTTAALTTRAITNNTSATAVTASTNLITANTLYYHKGNSNITTVGTITSGTWNGTAIAAAYIGNHSTDKLTSGTLPLGRGGTNATTAAAALLSIGAVQRNTAWNTCADGIAHYCYEGTGGSSTYDLPIDNVHLLRLGYNATRGVAIAAKWSSGEYGLWINRMHTSWQGWQPLSNTYYAASGTEKVIGYWAATSKPIYRYVYVKSGVAGTGAQTICTLPRQPATVLQIYGAYKNSDSTLWRSIGYYQASGYFTYAQVNNSQQVIVGFGPSMSDSKTVTVVVEYIA